MIEELDDTMLDEPYWKYCERCGKELIRESTTKPTRYDKVTKKPFYTVVIKCPAMFGDRYHFWAQYEVEDPNDNKVKELSEISIEEISNGF